MESKIFIDINYATRCPQIIILKKESEDSRDKLVSMLLGESMPGVLDGYCRIERTREGTGGHSRAIITPVHPIELINHIPLIAKFAQDNDTYDTSGVPAKYRKIIQEEYERIGMVTASETSTLNQADIWAVKNLPPELYKKWTHEIMYPQKSLKGQE